ncbi:uncharacterized protein LY89DRAFT_662932 [Mollisia scopiformis]|uniref:2EXR domain-containing protein n=1 Tax=Mollisia scopiformis TaxID=149040 RepID=A0A194XVY1_MOLSC|nr:uncharacterized protein LY89DRAFT_662932 [Mollisia scopiformis]KUJ24174.1 hypothetical protein LY89DRAFT_662932 [Mollisia scopiformis]
MDSALWQEARGLASGLDDSSELQFDIESSSLLLRNDFESTSPFGAPTRYLSRNMTARLYEQRDSAAAMDQTVDTVVKSANDTANPKMLTSALEGGNSRAGARTLESLTPALEGDSIIKNASQILHPSTLCQSLITASHEPKSISTEAATPKVSLPLTEFHLFSKLPIELRTMVWKEVFPEEARIVEILWTEDREFSTRIPIPIELHLCSESRSLALKKYKVLEVENNVPESTDSETNTKSAAKAAKLSPQESSEKSLRPFRAYFNCAKDVLYFPKNCDTINNYGEIFGSFLCKLNHEAISTLQHLALNDPQAAYTLTKSNLLKLSKLRTIYVIATDVLHCWGLCELNHCNSLPPYQAPTGFKRRSTQRSVVLRSSSDPGVSRTISLDNIWAKMVKKEIPGWKTRLLARGAGKAMVVQLDFQLIDILRAGSSSNASSKRDKHLQG